VVDASLLNWGRDLTTEQVAERTVRVYRDRSASLVELLDDSARWGDRPYLAEADRRLSFVAHRHAARSVAWALQDAGVNPGDTVVVLGANAIEWLVTFWAILEAGAVVVMGNAWWSAREVEAALATVAPALVVADADRLGSVPAGVPTLAFADVASAMAGDRGITAPVAATRHEDDPAVVLFTSGTTGAAKGAVLSHRAVLNTQQGLLDITRRLPAELPADYHRIVSLLSVPLFHLGGLQALVAALLTGATLVFLPGRFDAAEALALIENEGVTTWSAVPTMVRRVIDHPDAQLRDVSSVRSVMIGGAPVAPALLERVAAAFPNARRGTGSSYGLTEAGGVVATGVGTTAAEPGAVGRPLPTVEVRITPHTGEILVRSPSVMTGYLGGNGDDGIDTDGWLHTGDVGYLDVSGGLHVVDRSKDIVIRGGENVAAAHVESHLLAHDDVAEAAVIGLAHSDLGEEVAAVIVAQADRHPTEIELRAFLAERLAHFEVPTRWWLRSEPLPVTDIGKVAKRLLRDSWPQP
jgi:long-chain acyl-CoA synthetase